MFLEYKDIFSIIDEEQGFTEEYVFNLKKSLLSAYSITSSKFSQHMRERGIEFDALVSEGLIDQVIVDTVQDLKRLKAFHPIEKVNSIKEACYLAYWCIKKKPLFVTTEVADIPKGRNAEEAKHLNKSKVRMLFFNEFVMASHIIASIFNAEKQTCKSVQNGGVAKHKQAWEHARRYLFYYLVYRLDSPKSLEAFAIGCILHPIWEQRCDFWGGHEVDA